jgi:hypothetical protein
VNARYFQVTVPAISQRDFWDFLARDGRFAPLRARVAAVADQAPRYPVLPHASDYVALVRHDDRSGTDRYHVHDRFAFSALCFHRCLLGLDPHDQDDRLLDWLWGHLTLPTWAVGGLHPRTELPSFDSVQLDLAGCEMAANLAETREALLPWMNLASSTLADRVVAEIDARILKPFLEIDDLFWMQGKINWTGVCAGSILAACESLAAQGLPRPDARAKAIKLLQRYLDTAFTEHGECEEGIGYWRYGMQMACLGLSRLSQEELRANIDQKRLQQVAAYPGSVHLFDETFWTANDGSMKCPAAASFVPWLAATTADPFLAYWSGEIATDHIRTFPLLLRAAAGLNADPQIIDRPRHAIPSATPSARFLPDQQTAIFQLTTPAGELIACLSGGHNAEPHNHNDLGQIIVVLNQQIVLPDLGSPRYTPSFFSATRYSFLAAASRGHSCPLVNGHEQRPGREAAGKLLACDSEPAQLVLDLTAAYPPAAALQLWTRKLSCEPSGNGDKCMILRDAYRTTLPNIPIVHVIWSAQPPQVGDTGTLQLGNLRLHCSAQATLWPQVVTVNADDHRLNDFAGRQLYRLEFHCHTDAQGKLEIQTLFAAGLPSGLTYCDNAGERHEAFDSTSRVT